MIGATCIMAYGYTAQRPRACVWRRGGGLDVTYKMCILHYHAEHVWAIEFTTTYYCVRGEEEEEVAEEVYYIADTRYGIDGECIG